MTSAADETDVEPQAKVVETDGEVDGEACPLGYARERVLYGAVLKRCQVGDV